MKKNIDPIDKAILSTLLNNGCTGDRWISTNEFTKLTNITNWKTVARHLSKLRRKHYVKSRTRGADRSYDRGNQQVTAARKIEWTLNVEQD